MPTPGTPGTAENALALARVAAIVGSPDAEIIGTTRDGVIACWRPGAQRLSDGSRRAMCGSSIDFPGREGLENQLRISEQRLAKAQELGRFGSWEWDIAANLFSWSAQLYAIYGLDPDEFAPSYEGFLHQVHPADCPLVEGVLSKAFETGQPFDVEFQIVLPDGSVRFLRARGDVVMDQEGHPSTMHGTAQDVTEQRRSEAALQESVRSFRTLFAENPRPIYVWDQHTFRILAVNDAAIVQYGYAPAEFTNLNIKDLRDLDLSNVQFTDITHAITVEGRTHFKGIRHRTKAGESFDVEIDIHPIEFEGQRAYISVVEDVTERLRLQCELEHQAFHDALTGLPNRALFADRLEHAHLRLLRSSSRYAVLMLDLDDFKRVNDSLGHAAGDTLLLEVAQRLAASLRPGDTAARLGGDEFGILLEDIEEESVAVRAANRLLTALRPPISVAGRSVSIAGTVGVAFSSDITTAPSDLVRNADIALFASKASGKGRAEVFRDLMHTALLERLILEQQLRVGIDRNELVLHYQPKVDTLSGRIIGVEALVRWHHPTRGLLLPASFMAVAESTGLIVDLDAWVLEAACRQASAWALSESSRLSMAVNVSGRVLDHGGLLDRVREVLDATGLDPRLLELELTENAAVRQVGPTLSALREIRALGVHIAIDDFGTGYSMLSRLQDFPIDTLKIDLSFIKPITSPESSAPIVAATLAMAEGLGLTVVAEGVETNAQRIYLARHGCHQLQGFLISRPVEPAQIPVMLRTPPLLPMERPARETFPSIATVPSEPPT